MFLAFFFCLDFFCAFPKQFLRLFCFLAGLFCYWQPAYLLHIHIVFCFFLMLSMPRQSLENLKKRKEKETWSRNIITDLSSDKRQGMQQVLVEISWTSQYRETWWSWLIIIAVNKLRARIVVSQYSFYIVGDCLEMQCVVPTIGSYTHNICNAAPTGYWPDLDSPVCHGIETLLCLWKMII